MSDGNSPIWGMIIPLDKALVSGKIDLRRTEYTFGTGDACDYQIFYSLPQNEGPHHLEKYSEKHFRLEKDDIESESLYYIHDLSDHGTYVNGKKIGKNNKRPLEPNSDISLVSVDNKVFIFIVETDEDLLGIPQDIKSSYIISKTLGRGAFGKVRLLFTQDGTAKVAMKCIEKSPYSGPTDKEVLRETEIMVKLKHPCIIEIIETFNKPNCLYIIMELAEAGTLTSRLRKLFKLEETVTMVIMHQILLAVEYLHKMGVTHRDLKPDNILLASWSHEPLIKVTDFGVSKAVNTQTLMKTLAGTPCYIAPEIWKNQILRGDYSNAVDVWSIGIMLYQCLIGDLPIKVHGQGAFRHDLMETYTIQQRFETYAWTKMPLAEDLGRKLLKVEATERILVRDALKHPWFENEQSRRKVEELTGLALGDSGKAAMNPSDRRSSLTKEEDGRGQQAPSSGNNHYPSGLHYQAYQHGNQPFAQECYHQPHDGHQQYQPIQQQPYSPDPKNNHYPQAQNAPAPNYPYTPKEDHHFEIPYSPNRLNLEPGRSQSPIQRSFEPGRPYSPSRLQPEPESPRSPYFKPYQEPARPYSPSRLIHNEPERPSSPRFKPYQEPERAHTPNRNPYNEMERPYSPSRQHNNRRFIQPRDAFNPRRLQGATEEHQAIQPPQQAAAEGIYMSAEEIAVVKIPADGNEAQDQPAKNYGQQKQVPQQDAGQMTIIDTRQPAVIHQPESNLKPFAVSPRRNSDDSYQKYEPKFQEFQGDLLEHKKFKSQEELRVSMGPVLTPAPRIQPRRTNLRQGIAHASPHRRGLAPRRPLDKINTRGFEYVNDRTPPRSPVEEVPPEEEQPQASPKPDLPTKANVREVEKPEAQQQDPEVPRYKQQFQKELQHIVTGAENLELQAKFEKTKKDVDEIHAQQNFEQQNAGHNWEEPRQIQLYPHHGAVRHIPEYVVTTDDIKQIQDVIPNYAADVVGNFLKMHHGDKNEAINSMLHMMNNQ